MYEQHHADKQRTVVNPIFLSIFNSRSLRTCKTRRINANSQAYSLILDVSRENELSGCEKYVPFDIGQQLAHEARTLVPVLHLLLLHSLQNACNSRVKRDRDKHDPNADKRGPT